LADATGPADLTAALAQLEQERTARLAAERKARRLTVVAAAVLGAALLVAGGAWAWVLRDRAARQAATEQAVQQALEEAQRLGEQAKWEAARAAAGRAEALVDQGGANEALRRRVRDLRADLELVGGLERRAAGMKRVSADPKRPR
jgi:hypothetical protein